LFNCLKTLQKYVKNHYEIFCVVLVAKNVVKTVIFGESVIYVVKNHVLLKIKRKKLIFAA